MSKSNDLAPYFLGAYAENNTVFESIWLELYRDHVSWRRGFHPEDEPPIKAEVQFQPNYLQSIAKTKQSLHKLSAKLKQSVPFYHPRYIGHMSSDLLMPGLLAQMITTLYNPNNVSTDAAPVTTRLELEYGDKLANMFGFNTDPEHFPCAFGHLTSGGTVANYQAVWYAKALKYYPLALQKGLSGYDNFELDIQGTPLTEHEQWQLFNLPFDQIVQLRIDFFTALQTHSDEVNKDILHKVSHARIEHLGPIDFFAQHPGLKQPLLLVPTTAHYSWQKAAKILGLGTQQIVKVVTDEKMRICSQELSTLMAKYAEQKQPILALVGVLGTTEFGTIDPVADMVAIRQTSRSQGLEYFIHIDAAWGGYLSAMFRDEQNNLRDYAQLKSEFRYFPSASLYAAFEALDQVESITIDPHKLGYIPFGCGAFVCRNKAARGLMIEDAPYVFAGNKYSLPEPQLGQYIFEGSKPGAVAAAVSVAEEVLPFNAQGLGRLPQHTITVTEYFYDRVKSLAKELAPYVQLNIPIEPDTNLICLAINPKGNVCVAQMNKLMERLCDRLKVDPTQPLQNTSFIASSTKILRVYLSATAASTLCQNLGLDESTFVLDAQQSGHSDHLFVLRHTLMNPWLIGEHGNYIDRYLAYLKELIMDEIAACGSSQ
ncbi:MAG: glutamate/tyrosine decarboxylase-like PLP-dependent enzyme [Paraglaciecola sp.]|jgi:glutamate/tyrosine decarboxylase-like PLP-dependent enzyme